MASPTCKKRRLSADDDDDDDKIAAMQGNDYGTSHELKIPTPVLLASENCDAKPPCLSAGVVDLTSDPTPVKTRRTFSHSTAEVIKARYTGPVVERTVYFI